MSISIGSTSPEAASASNLAQVKVAKKQSKQLEKVVMTLLASIQVQPARAPEQTGQRLNIVA
ncbi:MAG: hypothetical protein D6719_09230 [Candidatus Dadabacteria bacterium]|nr:MAG: hypothetical protein D6719_09230 [Candidatus Dadabacteria bacterium]